MKEDTTTPVLMGGIYITWPVHFLLNKNLENTNSVHIVFRHKKIIWQAISSDENKSNISIPSASAQAKKRIKPLEQYRYLSHSCTHTSHWDHWFKCQQSQEYFITGHNSDCPHPLQKKEKKGSKIQFLCTYHKITSLLYICRI